MQLKLQHFVHMVQLLHPFNVALMCTCQMNLQACILNELQSPKQSCFCRPPWLCSRFLCALTVFSRSCVGVLRIAVRFSPPKGAIVGSFQSFCAAGDETVIGSDLKQDNRMWSDWKEKLANTAWLVLIEQNQYFLSVFAHVVGWGEKI